MGRGPSSWETSWLALVCCGGNWDLVNGGWWWCRVGNRGFFLLGDYGCQLGLEGNHMEVIERGEEFGGLESEW